MKLTDRFIAFEGLDGCGKTTVSKAFAHKLLSMGIDVLHTRQPSSGRVGQMISDMLKTSKLDIKVLALLFAADRLQHYNTVIEPALSVGKVVVCDRYRLSGLAYQSPKAGLGWVQHIDAVPDPAFTFLLDLPPETAFGRIKHRGKALDYFESVEKLSKIREEYLKLATGGSNYDSKVILLDAMLPTSELVIKALSCLGKSFSGLSYL